METIIVSSFRNISKSTVTTFPTSLNKIDCPPLISYKPHSINYSRTNRAAPIQKEPQSCVSARFFLLTLLLATEHQNSPYGHCQLSWCIPEATAKRAASAHAAFSRFVERRSCGKKPGMPHAESNRKTLNSEILKVCLKNTLFRLQLQEAPVFADGWLANVFFRLGDPLPNPL